MKTRRLIDLHSVGKETVKNLNLLGIHLVKDLKIKDSRVMCDRLCQLTNQVHDICVLDVFKAVVEQANNPRPPRNKVN